METLEEQPIANNPERMPQVSEIQVENPLAVIEATNRYVEVQDVGDVAVTGVTEATSTARDIFPGSMVTAAKEQGDQWVSAETYSVLSGSLIKTLKSKISPQPVVDPESRYPLTDLIDASDPVDLGVLFDDEYAPMWQIEHSPMYTYAINKLANIAKQCTLESRKFSPAKKELLSGLFDKFGFTAKEGAEIFTSLADKRGDDGSIEALAKARANRISRSLFSLSAVNNLSPQAAPQLFRQFGIRHFYRYPPDQLIGQLQGKTKHLPEVAMTGTSDWNGALESTGWEINETFGDGVIYIEAGSVGELARRLVYVARQNGPIKKLVLNAHGNSDSILLGVNQSLSRDYVEASSGIRRLETKRILNKRAHIILSSCNVGQKNGFAEVLSEVTGAKVTAPDFAARGIEKSKVLRRIKFVTDDKKLKAKTF